MSSASPAAPAPIKPPFSLATATAKVRMAENAWNSRDPQRVSLAYTQGCRWRNRAEFIDGRARSSSSSRASGRANWTTG